MNQESTMLDELAAYVRRNFVSIALLYVAAFAVWGTWLVKDIVTFDAEALYNPAFATEWYDQWISLGRWMLLFLKESLGVVVINPYFSNAVLMIAFPASIVLWVFVIERWGKKELPAVRALFFLIYLTHPVWALMFSYRMHMEVLSLVMCAMPLSMSLFTDWLEKGGIIRGLAAFSTVVCCFGSFQSFMFMFADACVIYMFMHMEMKENEELSSLLKTGVRIALFTLGAYVCWYIISYIVCVIMELPYGDSYLSDQFVWGTRSVGENVKVIAKYICDSTFGTGGKHGAAYAVVSIVFFARCMADIIGRKAHALLRALAASCIWIIPFALEIVTAGDVVFRSQYAFVLSCAFMGMVDLEWIICLLKDHHRVIMQTVCVLFGMILVLPQLQITTRLLYTDVRVMEQDLRMFGDIYERSMSLGANKGYSIWFDGGQGNAGDESLLESEVVGFSYFEYSGMFSGVQNKLVQAMRAYGYDLLPATPHHAEVGAEVVKSLKVWPEAGSVCVLEDERLIVVRLN